MKYLQFLKPSHSILFHFVFKPDKNYTFQGDRIPMTMEVVSVSSMTLEQGPVHKFLWKWEQTLFVIPTSLFKANPIFGMKFVRMSTI